MMLPETTRSHLLLGLAAMPQILALLTRGLDPDEGRSGRFSVREVLAHLADWDGVFLERLHRSGSNTPVDDPDSWERRHLYQIDLDESLGRFRDSRARLVQAIRDRLQTDPGAALLHPRHGRMTIEVQLAHIAGHDLFHLEQLTSREG